LGIRQIEQLEALPQQELASRFGSQLLEQWERATGQRDEPLPVYQPPPRFAADWSPEFPTARRETIEAALADLADRLCEMLRRSGRGATQLTCRLECAVGEPPEISVGLFHPTAWAQHLVQLLQVRLERLQLPGAVRHIRLAATATAPRELRQQELFFEESLHGGPRQLAGLVDRLSNRLGHQAVLRARLIPDAQPEMACRYVALVGRGRSQKTAAERVIAPRPVRLLTTPLRLAAGLGAQFCFAGHCHQVAQAWGPERIETGWWRGQAVGRDYYRVETTAGYRFWIFRRLEDGLWFLHGVFE
jgi:protein ImuB